jgi:RNA polymerase sigma-70 factor (ECF subfamily)
VTEADLIKQIKKDPSSFSEVFRLYYKPLFGYILRRTGNFDETADIAANTFLKAFTAINSFSYRGISIKIWLYRIATNEVNQFFRNSKKSKSIFEKLDDNDEYIHLLAQDKDTIDDELNRHVQFLNVQEALKTLPLKYQEVLSLRYFEGKDNKEIADILSMNEGTLKSLISRGLVLLREKCNQY